MLKIPFLRDIQGNSNLLFEEEKPSLTSTEARDLNSNVGLATTHAWSNVVWHPVSVTEIS